MILNVIRFLLVAPVLFLTLAGCSDEGQFEEMKRMEKTEIQKLNDCLNNENGVLTEECSKLLKP